MYKPLIIGNWKLNGNKNMINKFIFDLKKIINKLENIKLVIAPPLIYLEHFQNLILHTKFSLAAQNVDINKIGPFTGETSIDMLKDIGIKYVIIGHSERRIFHNESDNLIAKKFFIVKSSGLIPVLCIGESENDYKNKKTKEVCMKQIDSILSINKIESLENSVIAYEPIWAIGKGISASIKKIKKTISFIRNYIESKKKDISKKLIIQYGGSVNKNNAKIILKQGNANGLLVGNSSLTVDFFSSF